MTYTIPSYTVHPGSVYQPKPISAVDFPVDFLAANVVGCWSTRQLLSTGSGNIIRGRDATTNEEDFTSAAYPAGVVTLASGGDAFCPQLYDQSGNANHATQAVAASQPKLVDTGSLIVDASGRPVMEFDGSADSLTFGSEFVLSGDFSVYFSIKNNILNTKHILYKNSTNRILIQGSPNAIIMNAGGTFSFVGISPALLVGQFYDICLSRLSGSVSLYVNGVFKSAMSNNGSLSLTSILSADADVGLVSIFNRALSAPEVTQLHNALA